MEPARDHDAYPPHRPPSSEEFHHGYSGFPHHDAPPPPPPPYPHEPPSHYPHLSAPTPYPPPPEPPLHHHHHRPSPASNDDTELPRGRLVRIFCKANPAFNLAVQHNGVVMLPANTEDEAQQWIMDLSYGLRVTDNYGHPAFSLVNKKTKKILKHAKLKGQQVLLMDYRPDIKDDDILWSESQDFDEGFKTIRSASDTLLNMTVFEGKKQIRNGSALVLDTWHKADHQLWKLFSLWSSDGIFKSIMAVLGSC